ncbi:hypothetical protein MATL_G00183640 [Megalops atlanticus]|uniref:ZP domain-containing protein n=1 Tax=Megalops atlanticus TaxID=7932 RepID=A0A9D3PMP2_MEGAT|nr:hypothetical protein MATL_G00183640 [Megalops atlanticus]
MLQLTLLLLLTRAFTASASHFYGGTMTFTPKGRTPDGSLMVDFRFKHALSVGCTRTNPWSCYSGSCGNITRFIMAPVETYHSSAGDSWCQAEGFVTRRIPSDKPFELRAASSGWVFNIRGGGGWNLLTYVDLGIRSDTNAPNRSPLTTIIPSIRIPQNCPRRISIMAHDPDGDRVRCRYGQIRDVECGDCYQHQNFHLDQDTCTLSYSFSSLGAHVFELVLEDFPTQPVWLQYSDGTMSLRSPQSESSTTPSPPTTASYWLSQQMTSVTAPPPVAPMSRLPLQFALKVDGQVPSCTEGLYLPRFLHPTPHNGEFLNASVDQNLEIRVKAEAIHSQFSEFIISGPLNITKTITLDGRFAELTISWTPVQNDLHDHFPICFIAVSQSGSDVYHSEMRCIIVIVGHITGGDEANVVCTESTMTVEVRKSSIIGLHDNHLRLNDPSCTLISNNTHVVATMSLNSCGTELEEDDDNLIFKNEISTFDELNQVITREHRVEIEFSCVYPKKGTVSLEFRAHRIPYVFTERGFGKFTYRFEFFHTSLFNRMVDPSTYPVEVALKDMIYMEIISSSSLPNTVMFVESCRATPIDDPTYHVFYSIIENGCVVDDTVQVYPGNSSEYRFGMEAFTFIGMHQEVFISCSVILCQAEGISTRCAQGCINASAPSAGHHHHRRSVGVQTSRHYISQGPLRLTRSSTIEGSSMSLNMNLVVCIAALLAAVAMLSGVMVFKTKQSRVKYQVLPGNDF